MLKLCFMPFLHGPHCRIRSFPTKCPECKSPVLFWECSHGTRIFFDYPIYGKPMRHICQKKRERKSFVLITRAEQNQKQLQESTYQCPVCGKLFENEKSLLYHINQKKKQDDNHAEFFGFQLDLIDFDSILENSHEIIQQSQSINLNDNTFDLSDQIQDPSRFKTKQNLSPNQQEFFVLKHTKTKTNL
jgi:uncharacterized C2H2 Zn-finger protein